ncbi:hypothetical protein LCGC14_1697190 [marine sediment metagenome]|uniref:Uncharacterized protein n=1 Tax=marine sediment metagenome TaxID=412755 RepID=A0A0F9HJI8_9ZZZZ
MAKVKCAWTGRLISVELDPKTGCYWGRCKCRRNHLAVIHPITYRNATRPLFAA